MVFDMILSSHGVVVLGFGAQELISTSELKRALYACLKSRSSVTLRIHVVGELKVCDTRAAFAKLYVVVLHGLLTLGWKLELHHW
jgi:hypothetical protein